MTINSGPKPIAKSTGKGDKRQRVTPENKPKHPDLKEYVHKKGNDNFGAYIAGLRQ